MEKVPSNEDVCAKFIADIKLEVRFLPRTLDKQGNPKYNSLTQLKKRGDLVGRCIDSRAIPVHVPHLKHPTVSHMEGVPQDVAQDVEVMEVEHVGYP